MSIQAKPGTILAMGSFRSFYERWIFFGIVARIQRLAFAASRSWRRRRTLLGAVESEEVESDDTSGFAGAPGPEGDDPDEDPWAASEPYVKGASSAKSESADSTDGELEEQFEAEQEVLDSSGATARMADDFDVAENGELPTEEWLEDDSSVDASDESGMQTLSDSLYDKLMKSHNRDDDFSSEEDLTSSDSSTELVFSNSELEEGETLSSEVESLPEEVSAATEMAGESDGDAAKTIDRDGEAEGLFVRDDEHVIAGEGSSVDAPVYPAMPEGLLDSADSDYREEPTLEEPKSHEPDQIFPGAAMKDKAESNGSKQELATSSRMERLKPKSANSLTGAPPPKVDGRVEDSVLAPESEVLLVAVHAPERNTFRTYLRRHDIPCRAAISAENAVSVVLGMKPAAVLVSGSCMNPEEIITLVDDLNDMVDAPVLALLTEPQIKLLSNDPLAAHVLQYPASLRHIRTELTRILLEEGNAKPRCSLRSATLPE